MKKEISDTEEQRCIFCQIAVKKVSVHIIYENKNTMAFLDNRPAEQGHTLVIPKNHIETIYDLSEDDISCLFTIVRNIAVTLKNAFNPDGMSIIQRNGIAADQHIFHVHVHVIPRFTGRHLRRMEEIPEASSEELETIATRLRNKTPA